ncbi:MAG: LOG family protein [Chloroflexota bacterium]
MRNNIQENPVLRITVFGGSKPLPGQPAYHDALRLGQALGSRGYTVLTGGYMGTMEAVSRGAAESGGHVIGVTCDEIESWRPRKHNAWVQEEMRLATLRDRLNTLIDHCDAAIALPGGIGTLAEIVAMWSLLQVNVSTPRPLILIGTGWQRTFDSLFRELGTYITENDRRWIHFASDVDQAFIKLEAMLS